MSISDEERLAAAIVETMMPQRQLVHRDNGGRQVADFEVLARGDGRSLGLLEVTSTHPGPRRSFEASLARMNWTFEGLNRTWWVRVKSVDRDEAPLKDLHETLPRILSTPAFADTDATIIEIDPWNPALPAWHRELDRLGVVTLMATSPHDGPHRIEIRKPSTGGGLGWSEVNADVAIEVNKPDNLAKLRHAPIDSVAELFVWLSDTVGQITLDFAAHGILRGGEEPEGIPLPTGVTGIWAASGPHDRDHLARALFFTDGARWRQLEPPRRT